MSVSHPRVLAGVPVSARRAPAQPYLLSLSEEEDESEELLTRFFFFGPSAAWMDRRDNPRTASQLRSANALP